MEIYCSFSRIFGSFPASSLRKGEKLQESGHVQNLKETRQDNNHAVIAATVIPQTNVFKTPYAIQIKVDGSRNITWALCSCKAGLGGTCKHIAAVFVSLNFETSSSKTSKPQAWGKPSEAAVQKYGKGKRILTLFASSNLPAVNVDDDNIHREAKDIFFRHLKDIKCPVTSILQEEVKNEEEKTTHNIVLNIVNSVVREEKKHKILNLQKTADSEFRLYQSYSCTMAEKENSVTLKSTSKSLSSDIYQFYQNNICVSEDEMIELSLKTDGQSSGTYSSSQLWNSERRKRITASIAHRIKTRRANFDSLAMQLGNPRQFKTNATVYGTNSEREARTLYSAISKKQVVEVGLCVSAKQPWLACSPDGLILDNQRENVNALLEIKCPYTLKDNVLVEGQNVFINYLEFSNDELMLKKKPFILHSNSNFFIYFEFEDLSFVHVYQERL